MLTKIERQTLHLPNENTANVRRTKITNLNACEHWAFYSIFFLMPVNTVKALCFEFFPMMYFWASALGVFWAGAYIMSFEASSLWHFQQIHYEFWNNTLCLLEQVHYVFWSKYIMFFGVSTLCSFEHVPRSPFHDAFLNKCIMSLNPAVVWSMYIVSFLGASSLGLALEQVHYVSWNKYIMSFGASTMCSCVFWFHDVFWTSALCHYIQLLDVLWKEHFVLEQVGALCITSNRGTNGIICSIDFVRTSTIYTLADFTPPTRYSFESCPSVGKQY